MRCRARDCEAELTWAEAPSGRTIPLHAVTLDQWRRLPRREALYRIEDVAGRLLAVLVPEPEKVAAQTSLYLNHFIDCVAREQFRRRR